MPGTEPPHARYERLAHRRTAGPPRPGTAILHAGEVVEMSIQEVERVTQRALREEAFRELLRDNPGAALASYELTAEERATILGAYGPSALEPPTELPR